MKKIRVSNLAYSKPESYVVKVEAESLLAGSGKHGGTGGHEDAEDDNDEGQGTSGTGGHLPAQDDGQRLT